MVVDGTWQSSIGIDDFWQYFWKVTIDLDAEKYYFLDMRMAILLSVHLELALKNGLVIRALNKTHGGRKLHVIAEKGYQSPTGHPSHNYFLSRPNHGLGSLAKIFRTGIAAGTVTPKRLATSDLFSLIPKP